MCQGIPIFLSVALSSAGMLLVEVWTFELLTFMAGMLGAVELATQVLLARKGNKNDIPPPSFPRTSTLNSKP